MATLQSDQSLSLNADETLRTHPDQFYLEYFPHCPTSENLVPHHVIGLEPQLIWQHPVLGRLLPGNYDPSSQSTRMLRHLLDQLLIDLTERQINAPPRLSLFLVLSANQLANPGLSHWFTPIKLLMAYHRWSLSLVFAGKDRDQGDALLTPLCDQGPVSVLDTAYSKRLVY